MKNIYRLFTLNLMATVTFIGCGNPSVHKPKISSHIAPPISKPNVPPELKIHPFLPGNKAAYQSQSDNCSSEFVSNYNSVLCAFQSLAFPIQKSSPAKSEFSEYSEFNLFKSMHLETIRIAKKLVSEFKSRYDDVSCIAKGHRHDRFDYLIRVNVRDEIKTWENILEAAEDNRTPSIPYDYPISAYPILTTH